MKAKEFIREFTEEQFPCESGLWVGFDDHDPPFTMIELTVMHRQGIIDMDKPNRRYRLTMKATKLRAANE